MKIRWNTGTLAIAAMVASLGLQACSGLQPLYSINNTAGDSVASELSDISIPLAQSRTQQLIRNNLISTMSPPGQEGAGKYQLLISSSVDEVDITVERNTDVSRRSYRLNVAFTLKEGRSGKKLYAGKTFSEVSYDSVTSEFTNLQAKTNAQKRATREVSNDIRTRLAAFFASRQ